ncbi:MAG: hypothetical protein HKN42_17555 [Granulosicoccus sp.]|nr:hypothetical protein [Granulosicoccus sp.]
MNIDSTAPASDPPGQSGGTVDAPADPDLWVEEHLTGERTYHDLHASLAIINGYSQALGATFREFTEEYNVLVDSSSNDIGAEAAFRIMTMEADCRFCLSRLCQSIEKLKISLQSGRQGYGPDNRIDAE